MKQDAFCHYFDVHTDCMRRWHVFDCIPIYPVGIAEYQEHEIVEQNALPSDSVDPAL